jgi:hypothetical protein
MVEKLDNLIDRVNSYLKKQGFQRLKTAPKDIFILFEMTVRELWRCKDRDKIEKLTVEVAQMLKPFFGGKKIEDAMDDIFDKLTKEDQANAVEAKKESEVEAARELKEKLNDPNYVPTFEELMKAKGKDKP